jgi:hypothetical protein
MAPGKRDLVRYREVRRADVLDDQKSAVSILDADSSLTQEQLQELLLSQVKRIIWGNDPGHWNDDFLASSVPALASLSQTFEASCDATDAVDMYVHVTGPLLGGLRQVTRADISDLSKLPAVGTIIEKTSLVTCIVRTFGAVTTPVAVTPGKRYFLGIDGLITLDPPGPGLGEKFAAQIVGIALDSTTILVNPNPNFIIRVGR